MTQRERSSVGFSGDVVVVLEEQTPPAVARVAVLAQAVAWSGVTTTTRSRLVTTLAVRPVALCVVFPQTAAWAIAVTRDVCRHSRALLLVVGDLPAAARNALLNEGADDVAGAAQPDDELAARCAGLRRRLPENARGSRLKPPLSRIGRARR